MPVCVNPGQKEAGLKKMREFEAAVVGAGPAGTACAEELDRLGVKTVLIDKARFPRQKLCAGWITPEVMKDLMFSESDYPYNITRFNTLNFHLYGIRIPVKTLQYSIRRYEFDHWLLKRIKVPFYRHKVNRISFTGSRYVIDDRFSVRYLIGAGGTTCPVYRQIFKKLNPRSEKQLIVTMEKEYQTNYKDKNCHLWFFDKKLPGYSWYVPKADGYLNLGIGGKACSLKKQGISIQQYFELFLKKLENQNLVKTRPEKVKGYAYYLRDRVSRIFINNAFLTGDAAGLATKDMGEGIGPAVKSGILAARSIGFNRPYELDSINRFSLPKIILSQFKFN